jgi:hypothetical protein
LSAEWSIDCWAHAQLSCRNALRTDSTTSPHSSAWTHIGFKKSSDLKREGEGLTRDEIWDERIWRLCAAGVTINS